MKEKNKEEICSFCGKPIKSGDRFVFVGTYDKLKFDEATVVEEKFYHIQCWKKYFQSKLMEGMKGAMNKAGGMLNNLIGRIPGNGNEGGISAI